MMFDGEIAIGWLDWMMLVCTSVLCSITQRVVFTPYPFLLAHFLYSLQHTTLVCWQRLTGQ